jgi:Uma2 family endonuclease
MPQAVELWTAEMVRALPDDGKRYECVDGELLVSPAPNFPHQRIVGSVYRRLYEYLRGTTLGEVCFSPADIELDRPTLVQPDVFVVPLGAAGPPRTWRDIEGLLLAVEVLSPSTARYDRIVKRGKYQRAGVPEYWVVDIDARLVERWRPGDERPEILAESLVWRPGAAAEPLTLELPALFAEAGGATAGGGAIGAKNDAG